MPKHTDQLHMGEKEEDGALFSAILHSAHDAIIAIDQNQNIILFNQGAKRIFEYSASEIIGQPLEILLPPVLSEVHRAHVRRFAESATIARAMGERREISGRRKDGTIFPAEASIAKVSTGGQTVFTVVLRDITDRKQAEIELFNAYDSTIEGWSRALDLRDKETEGHTQRVTKMTMKLTHAAGMTEAELVHVRRGALLHDIGKMGVPDNILLKPDKLTDEEWVAMRKHPIFAFELLSPIVYLRPALDIPYCHHEKWDGSGYPRGLKGEQIPLVARLFAVIDVWDALRSDRPYRQGWSKEKVIEHIKSLSGTHFEPKAVELFLKMMNEDDKDLL